jgi:hypothetical protein
LRVGKLKKILKRKIKKKKAGRKIQGKILNGRSSRPILMLACFIWKRLVSCVEDVKRGWA